MEYAKRFLALVLIVLGLVSISQVKDITKASDDIKLVTYDTIDLVQRVKEQREYNKIHDTKEEEVQEVIIEVPRYHGLTRDEVVNKASLFLNSSLSGTAPIFVDYAIQRGVDPLLAIGIVLQETGCYWSCSSLVNYQNNVGGMMGYGGALSFPTLDDGIRAFIDNIANNFVAYGLTDAYSMNPKYAEDPLWADRVTAYINKIIAA